MSTSPFSRPAWCAIVTSLLAATTQAGSLTLTDPPGPGDDTLWCGAYLAQPKPVGAGEAPEDGFLGEMFGNDEASDIDDDHPFGFIDIGLDGHAVRLFAIDGAYLLLGGDFVSASSPWTTLRMHRPVITSTSDSHGEGESTIDATALFRLERAGQAREFKGVVRCAALRKRLLPQATP